MGINPHWLVLLFWSEPLIFLIQIRNFLSADVLFTMAVSSSTRSAFLHDSNVHDFKTIFEPSFNIQEVDYNLLNKYVVYKVNQYRVINIGDYSLWESIQIDFMKFELEDFDQLDNTTFRIFRDYCSLHGF